MRVSLGDVPEILSAHPAEEYNRIATESGKFERLFHLWDNRGNVVEWIPVEKGKSALEIGAQAGAVTAALSKHYDRYVALDVSEEMKDACAKRKDVSDIEYVVSDVISFARNHTAEFDDIYLIGCLPEAEIYTGIPHGYDAFLDAAYSMLKENGRLILAVENKFGMKYWCGCREDYTGEFSVGLESFPNGEKTNTFSQKELKSLLEKASFKTLDWYYPYPDLYFAESVYSDDYLPKQGELMNNRNNYDRGRVLVFDELKVFNSVIKDDMFPYFANSYLVIGYKGSRPTKKPVYVKYSKQRGKAYALRTDIVSDGGKLFVTKKNCYPEGKAHVEGIYKAYDELAPIYEKQNLYLNEYKVASDGERVFTFIDGENLQSKIEDLIQIGELEEAQALFEEYIRRCFFERETVKFEKTDAFKEWYGDVNVPADMEAFPNGDCDLIASNIFITDDKWNIIDYEWSVDFPVPVKYLLYRSVFLAHHQMKRCDFLRLDVLMEKYHITKEEVRLFSQMDANFQAHVRGEVLSNNDVLARTGQETFTILEWFEVRKENERLKEEHARQNKHCPHGLRWLKRLGGR